MRRIRFTDAENLYFDENRKDVIKDGKLGELTPIQFQILESIVKYQIIDNRVCQRYISTEEIIEKVYSNDKYITVAEYTNINTEISRLRDKLDSILGRERKKQRGKRTDSNDTIIKNARGKGYLVNIEIEEIGEPIQKPVYDADYCKKNVNVLKIEEFLGSEQKQSLYIPLINRYYENYKNLSLEKFKQRNSGLSKDIRLVETYGYPKIEPIHGNERPWGLNESSKTGRYLVQAPAGFGKSTLMKSILLSTIYQDVKELNAVTDKDNLSERKEKEIASYKKLREFHDIQREYFPIMLETVKMNFKNISENSSDEEIFDLIYEAGGFSGYYCKSNLDDEGRIIDTKVQWKTLLEDCNRKEQLLFLIDGYDEISSRERIKCSNFLKKLGSSPLGSNSTIIVTSRPMADEDSLAGYKTYKIAATDINNDEEFVKDLIKKYLYFSSQKVDVDKLIEKMKENEFLHKLLISPYMIVLVTLALVSDKNYNEEESFIKTNRIINKLIESLAIRHREIYESMQCNPAEIRPLLEMYEEFAYEMLCNVTRGELGIEDSNDDFIDMAMETVEVVQERYKELYPETKYMYLEPEKLNKSKIVELLFTDLGLMEKTEEKVSFVAPEVITVELGARRLLRSFVRAENKMCKLKLEKDEVLSESLNCFFEDAELIDKKYRYNVFIAVITWLSDPRTIKSEDFWKLNIYDMRMSFTDILLEIVDYLIERCLQDKAEVKQALINILKESYGSNLLMRCRDRSIQEEMLAKREKLQKFVGEA